MRPDRVTFSGVAGVVLRLLNIVGPDLIVLGQKDYQQLVIVEHMIADLRLPVGVVAGDTRRDADGLAISSRNHYLTADERKRAPILHSTLEQLGAELTDGNRDYGGLEAAAVERLKQSGFEPEYVEVRRASDLSKPNGSHSADELIVVAAAWLGRARLIDNLRVVV